MKCSVLFTENLKLLRYGARRIVNQGGQYSGKTVNILGALATLAAEDTTPTITTITSMSMPHLKGGALRDFELYILPDFRGSISKINLTDKIWKFKSGSVLEFKVFENVGTAHGGKRDRLFINEADKMIWPIYWQLDSRSVQTIMDYNPSARFWAHEKVIGSEGTHLIISDHRHNPFLSKEKHEEIESIEDDELWKVYARGLTGNVSGVIFPNWEIIDDNEYPEDEEQIFSIDFGYTNDPTVIIKQCKKRDTIYVKELCYRPGLPPMDIASILMENGYNEDYTPFYCEHDPDMVRALRNLGLQCLPARKGAGSIKAGIELLKRHKVKYTHSSSNISKEREKYVWIKDKATGEDTNIPLDQFNHTFDAIRYGAYSRYLKFGEAA